MRGHGPFSFSEYELECLVYLDEQAAIHSQSRYRQSIRSSLWRGMAKEKRLQLNLRVEQEDLDAIERIRRALTPLPSVTDAVRQAIHELDKRLAKRGSK